MSQHLRVFQIPIVNGGNKFELLAQLGDIGRVDFKARMPFQLELRHPFESRGIDALTVPVATFINGIEADDGSGESWNIKGYLAASDVKSLSWLKWDQSLAFKGYYDTRHRRGFIKRVV